jgi:hypothetical protein
MSCDSAHVRGGLADGGLAVADHGVQQAFLLVLTAGSRALYRAGKSQRGDAARHVHRDVAPGDRGHCPCRPS